MTPAIKNIALLFAALCALLPRLASAAPTYTVTVLDPGTTALNNAGQTTGSFLLPNGQSHAFLRTGDVRLDLGTLGGGNSVGTAINNNGEVAGLSDLAGGSQHAFTYLNGCMCDIGALGRPERLNDAGQLIGNTDAGGFLYSKGSTTYLPRAAPYMPTVAYGLNNAGAVTGMYNDGAYIYAHGAITELNLGAISEGTAINDAGQVTGYVSTAGPSDGEAFLYSNGNAVKLGTLGGPFSYGLDLNARGDIVGTANIAFLTSHAFIYSDGVMRDLNSLIDPTAGWNMETATDINDAGQILARGCRAGECTVLLLDPVMAVPEPNVVAMLLAGLALLGWRGYRTAGQRPVGWRRAA